MGTDIGGEQYASSFNDSERIRELYQKNGFVLIRNALDRVPLDVLVSTIDTLLEAKLEQLGSVSVTGDLDGKIEQLARFGEKKVESLLRASRESLAFHELVLFPGLQTLISMVSDLKMPQIISETCMLRIDRQEASSRDFAWHYDAAYTAQPPQAVTCWAPLMPIDSEMGALRVIPGSHKQLHEVRFHKDLAAKKLSGPKRVELVNENLVELENRAIDICPVKLGDVILLHGWTLHRSGINRSKRARWVFNSRYSDLLDETILSKDWKVSRVGEPWVFQEYHPEMVKD